MLTGAGSKFNGTNRWFDKTLQLGIYIPITEKKEKKKKTEKETINQS